MHCLLEKGFVQETVPKRPGTASSKNPVKVKNSMSFKYEQVINKITLFGPVDSCLSRVKTTSFLTPEKGRPCRKKRIVLDLKSLPYIEKGQADSSAPKP